MHPIRKILIVAGAACLFWIATQQAFGLLQADPNEPNDSLASATEITLPFESRNLSLEPIGDRDFFTFELEERGFVGINIDADSRGSFLDAVLFLFDENGNEIDFNDDSDGLDPEIRTTLNPGRYFLLVSGFLDASTGFYDLSVSMLEVGECLESELLVNQTESWSLGLVEPGSRIQVLLQGPGATDFDLFLYEVVSENPAVTVIVGRGVGLSSNENVTYEVKGDIARQFIIVVRAFEGSGEYLLCRSISPFDLPGSQE